MPPVVQGENVIQGGQSRCEEIPAGGAVLESVEQEHGLLALSSPVQIVKVEASCEHPFVLWCVSLAHVSTAL